MKLEEIGTSEALVPIYETTRRHIAEDGFPYQTAEQSTFSLISPISSAPVTPYKATVSVYMLVYIYRFPTTETFPSAPHTRPRPRPTQHPLSSIKVVI